MALGGGRRRRWWWHGGGHLTHLEGILKQAFAQLVGFGVVGACHGGDDGVSEQDA